MIETVAQSDMASLPAQAGLRSNAGALVEMIGGPAVVANVCGVNRTQVWRWTSGRVRHIPQKHHAALLAYARKHRIDVPAYLFLVDEFGVMEM